MSTASAPLRPDDHERDRARGCACGGSASVRYRDAWSLQQGLHADPLGRGEDRLLLLEHPHTYTLGRNAEPDARAGRPGVGRRRAHRGRPWRRRHLSRPRAARRLPGAHPAGEGLGPERRHLASGRRPARHPRLRHDPRTGADRRRSTAWVSPAQVVTTDTRVSGSSPARPQARKIAAIGVRIERGRSLHGIALNVDPDLSYFGHIVPCGIPDFGVTSLAAEGVTVTMRQVVDAVVEQFAELWDPAWVERSDVVWRHLDADLAPFSRGAGPGEATDGSNDSREVAAARRRAERHRHSATQRQSDGTSVRLLGRLAEAGVSGGVEITERKPEWMRAPLQIGSRGAAAQAHRARPRPGHRVRGGGLPEPLGVLVRGDGDLHGLR